RHHGHDLARVEEQRQGPLRHDGGFDRLALVVDAGDRHREARIIGGWPDLEFFHPLHPELSIAVLEAPTLADLGAAVMRVVESPADAALDLGTKNCGAMPRAL